MGENSSRESSGRLTPAIAQLLPVALEGSAAALTAALAHLRLGDVVVPALAVAHRVEGLPRGLLDQRLDQSTSSSAAINLVRNSRARSMRACAWSLRVTRMVMRPLPSASGLGTAWGRLARMVASSRPP